MGMYYEVGISKTEVFRPTTRKSKKTTTKKYELFDYELYTLLRPGVKKFTEALRKLDDFECGYVFNDGGRYNVWIEIRNASTKKVREYSKLYCDFLYTNAGEPFEFMVFSSGEVKCMGIPKDSQKIVR